ncbi:hypothetical protein DASC09_030500 [Saccharomycopsis crataegensis]|uniref:Sphingoid long-chain base transporter RSB1 n=1 Tax=Saccharomycopsis crataegensis TaxID=43959 RepID=A0AAV5QL89_9ASCO|nr:hypothetical protein DASC09_030500 [Saccharomycopsis crataegensis]
MIVQDLTTRDPDYRYNFYHNTPGIAGNAVFLALFLVLVISHLFLALKYKQRWLGLCLFLGELLEILAYGGRLGSHNNPYDRGLYILQMFGTTIAPIFIVAGYYYLFAKFVVIYGIKYSIFKNPIMYSYLFMSCDLFSLILQGGGGGVASAESSSHSNSKVGIHIMIGGLVFQVVSMTVFLIFWCLFFYRIYFQSDKEIDPMIVKTQKKSFNHTSYKDHLFNPEFQELRGNKNFQRLPVVVTIGFMAIFIRCCYRVAELCQGWSGYLIIHEAFILVFDAMFMFFSCAIITWPYYPGSVFQGHKIIVAKGLWHFESSQVIDIGEKVIDGEIK